MPSHAPFPLDEDAIVEWIKTTEVTTSHASPLGSIYVILISTGEINRVVALCKKFAGYEKASFCGILLINVLIEFQYITEAKMLAQWVADQMHPSLKDIFHPYESFLTIAERTRHPDDIRRAEAVLIDAPEDSEREQGFKRLAEIDVDQTALKQTSINN